MPPRMLRTSSISFDSRFPEPPNGVGPTGEAVPGLRSKSPPPSHCDGKNAQEWCDGVFVSFHGMPSNVMSYKPSEKPRKNIFASPRPTPFELILNTPGVI